MFVDKIEGTLLQIKKSDKTRFEYVVWFPYTRGAMGKIRDGSLLAVKNFSSGGGTDCLSIIRVTSAVPEHYALGTDLKGYPGFLDEAATNAAKDWAQETPTEDTTKIVCTTVPSMFEIRAPGGLVARPDGEPKIEREQSLPMTGERVRLLDSEWTERIVNRDLHDLDDESITVGDLTNSDGVSIKVLWDSLIRTHFGIFAYTNAGKSNLLSTLTSKILEKDNDAKIVVYDLMGEYGALLADVLAKNPNAYVLHLTIGTVMDSLRGFWEDPTDGNLRTAAERIADTTILPKELMSRQREFAGPVGDMLRSRKIKVLEEFERLDEYVSKALDEGSEGKWGTEVENFRESVAEINTASELTIENVRQVASHCRSYRFPAQSSRNAQQVRNYLVKKLDVLVRDLEMLDKVGGDYKISVSKIVEELNAGGRQAVLVIQDSSDERIRRFSRTLGDRMLAARRSKGVISPPVSFVYDEADQFIAQDGRAQPSMSESKAIAEQLARRGRKYGLGIGIATQRIVYLDTNVLGQPHTYFVSKLPRASDREKIQEAFGLSDETLAESLRFGAGQWLLISHSSTGMDGLPIPVQLPNANDRIKEFLDGQAGDGSV